MEELRDSERVAIKAIVDTIALDVLGVLSVETVEGCITESYIQLARSASVQQTCRC